MGVSEVSQGRAGRTTQGFFIKIMAVGCDSSMLQAGGDLLRSVQQTRKTVHVKGGHWGIHPPAPMTPGPLMASLVQVMDPVASKQALAEGGHQQ